MNGRLPRLEPGECRQQELNERSDRDDIRLHAFIFSATDFQTLQEKQELDTREAFAARHIYFLEDGPTAIQSMIERTQHNGEGNRI